MWYNVKKCRIGEYDMDGKRVAIKYQYFRLCTIQGDDATDLPFDLRFWIEQLIGIRLEDRVKEINDINGRLEDVALVRDEFYVLNFMRMDVVSNTYVLAPDRRARHVDLEENEYIGKNTVVLYDPRFHVVMVQCNRGSYGTYAIQNYINSFINDGNLCYFRPIEYDYGRVNLDNTRVLKLDVRFANTRNLVSRDSAAFERIIDACNQTECRTAHLELGLGRSYTKTDELEPETIHGIIHEIRSDDNRGYVSSAYVTLSDDQKSEVFDLLQNILNDKINYVVQPRGELAFNLMANRMADKYYEGARARVANVLQR